MYGDEKRRDVQLLLKANVSRERIAKLTGVSVRTIRRIAQEPSRPAAPGGNRASVLASVGAAMQPTRPGPGRPSTVAPYRDAIAEMLSAEPGLKSLEVLKRLRDRGYVGGKSAVYALARELRAQSTVATPQLNCVAGQFSQHGFGEVGVDWKGGDRQRVKFFASRLMHSRYAVVTRVPDQRIETLVRALAEHFSGFGGLPLMAVFDRPEQLAIESDAETGMVRAWNPTIAEAMSRIGVAVEAGWPYKPRRNGIAGDVADWVRASFFKTRRFVNEDDLDVQLKVWLEEVNERRRSRVTARVPGEILREEELVRLRPVKLRPDQLDLRIPVQVGPTGMVTLENHTYAVPAEALGYSATLHLFRDRVVIVAGPYRVEHPRLSTRDDTSSADEPRAALLAAVSGRRGRMYVQCQQLLELGEDAKRVLTEFAHARPRRWPLDVEQLHELLQTHGSDALKAGLRRVAGLPGVSIETISREVTGPAFEDS